MSEPAPPDPATAPATDSMIGRSCLLVAGPAIVAVLWVFGALPAWGAAALGVVMSVLAVAAFLRMRPTDVPDVDGARVLVVGGGYAGMVSARALQARLPGGTRGGRHLGDRTGTRIASVTVVDPQAHMTYQPFLPEAAAGAIEPRHVTIGLRRALRRCDVVTGTVVAIDDTTRRAVVALPDGGARELTYDVLVVAPGTAPRTLPVPGLAERAWPFRTVTDALGLREHVLSRLDAAASTTDPSERRRLLTFTVVGGGFAGLEALGELEDMTRRAARHQPAFVAEEIRWVLLEAADRIMPEVGAALAARVHAQLVRRGIDVRIAASLVSAEGGRLVLRGGHTVVGDTVVLTAGSVANPLLQRTDLPLDPRGRVRCATTLQVRDRPHVFTAGDCAAVPDVTRPAGDAGHPTTAPTAQHAVRQARLLARNVDAFVAGRMLRGYRHRDFGSVAGLGRRRGAGQIGPLRIAGWPAWVLHRGFHLWAMPTADRTIRIALDWLISGLLGRDLVAVGRRDTPPVPEEMPEIDPALAIPSMPGPAGAVSGPIATSGIVPTGTTGTTGTWGRPDDARPEPRQPAGAVGVPVDEPVVGPRSEGIPALQIAAAHASGPLPALREPSPSGSFREPSPATSWDAISPSESFPEPYAPGTFGEPVPSGTFREPVPSGTFREPGPSGSFREPVPSGTFREPHPSDDGPRAPQPSTSRPRHAWADQPGR